MTITPQDVNVALKRAGYDVVFDELSAATSTISVDLARTLLQLLPVDESDDAPDKPVLRNGGGQVQVGRSLVADAFYGILGQISWGRIPGSRQWTS